MSNLTFVPRDPQDLDLAKRFTKACLKAGLFREIKPRIYVKPGERRRLKSQRARKAARKRASQRVVRFDANGDPR